MVTYCKLMEEKEGKTDCPFRDNIRVLAMDALEAQGPCWARHMQSYLLADEEFCMQVDSHVDFVDEWDLHMMEEWAATNNEYGVLSTYVQDYAALNINVNKRWEVAHLCEVYFPDTSNQPRNQQARAIHDMTEPKLTTTWGAGYSFSKCHAERRVPYDPHLDKIFDGEEFSRMARLWTNGYDVYSPRKGYIVHDYSHPDQKTTTSWRRNNKAVAGEPDPKDLANQRLWNLMEMPRSTEDGRRDVQAGPWGLGDRRTLDQFIQFTGVDLRNLKHIGETGDRCGSGVEWVPYTIDDGGSGGVGDEQPFKSWRTRKGIEPVAAGPHWAEVKRKLQAAGVEVWWDPRPDEHEDAPEPRDAPAANIALEEYLEAQTGARMPKMVIVAGGGGTRQERGGGAMAATRAQPPPLEEISLAAGAALAAEAAAAAAEGAGSAPFGVFVTVLACSGVAVWCWRVGRTKRKQRRVGARRRKQVMEWSDTAFSSNTLSPLGAGPSSFGWKGAGRSKRHQV